jgi:hypothetical protein
MGGFPRGAGDSPRVPGDSLRVPGDSPRVLGNSPRVLGDSLRVLGSSLRVLGDSLRVLGNSLRVLGNSLRVPGNSPRVPGNSLRVPGNSPRVAGHIRKMGTGSRERLARTPPGASLAPGQAPRRRAMRGGCRRGTDAYCPITRHSIPASSHAVRNAPDCDVATRRAMTGRGNRALAVAAGIRKSKQIPGGRSRPARLAPAHAPRPARLPCRNNICLWG